MRRTLKLAVVVAMLALAASTAASGVSRPDATSAATPEFWVAAGFSIAVEDERFPVVRRELG